VAFPLQATVLLSEPVAALLRGEFVLVEQRPRRQRSRPRRPARSWRTAGRAFRTGSARRRAPRGPVRTTFRHGGRRGARGRAAGRSVSSSTTRADRLEGADVVVPGRRPDLGADEGDVIASADDPACHTLERWDKASPVAAAVQGRPQDIHAGPALVRYGPSIRGTLPSVDDGRHAHGGARDKSFPVSHGLGAIVSFALLADHAATATVPESDPGETALDPDRGRPRPQ